MIEKVKEEYRKVGYLIEIDFVGEYYFMYNENTGEKVRLYYTGNIFEY